MVNSKKHSSFIKTFFPVPKYLSFDSMGIELTPDCIRVFKLKKNPEGLMPEIYDEVMLDKVCNEIVEGNPQDVCSDYLSALESLVKKHSMKYVVASLPEEKTYIYKTQIPIQAEGSIRDAVSFTIEENVPLDNSNITFDYYLISRTESFLNVVVFVISKDVLAGHTALLEKVGLVPISFESESQALARSVISKNDKETYLILNLSPQSAHVAIAEHGIVHYASSIPVDVSKIISDKEGREMADFIGQLNKLLVFWFTNSNEGGNKKINTAILSGVFSSEEGLAEYLTKHLKIDVQIANVWINCFSFNDFIPPLSQKESSGYGVAIGLSLSSPL